MYKIEFAASAAKEFRSLSAELQWFENREQLNKHKKTSCEKGRAHFKLEPVSSSQIESGVEIPIKLESGRYLKLNEATGKCCSECHKSRRILYRYEKSNRGVVYLCHRCKTIVCRRSFGEWDPDLLDIAFVTDFEGDPRKH